MATLKESVNAAVRRPVTDKGSEPVNGRGIKHRKLTHQELVSLAADIATGSRPYVPSLAHTCSALGVPIAAVRAEIKRRVAVNGNSNGRLEGPMGMAVELVDRFGFDGAYDLLLEATERF
jgi:hypothetical protein